MVHFVVIGRALLSYNAQYFDLLGKLGRIAASGFLRYLLFSRKIQP